MAAARVIYDVIARDRASRTFDTVGRSARNLERRTSRLSSSFTAVGAAALRAGKIVGVTAATGIGAAAALGLKTAASLEQAQIGFETLLGSGQKAQRFLAQLKIFAAKTPFELPGLIENARQLLGVGVAAKDVIPTLRTLGDMAGALGLTQDQYNRVLLAYTQILSKGKVQAEEMLQLTEAGVPAYQLLAKALHKPVPELQAMMRTGDLLAKDALPALLKQMHKDYGGAMAKQSRTLAGLWSTLKDTINIALADAIQPMIPILRVAVPKAAEIAGNAIHGFADAFTAVVDNGKKAGKFITDFLSGLGVIDTTVKVTPGPLQASAFAGQDTTLASTLGAQLRRAFDKGISNLDTNEIGQKLGEAVSRAIGWIGDHIDQITTKLASALSKIDWVNVGKTVGGHAIGFGIGLISGLGDDLFDPNFWKKHWWDVIVAVLSIGGVGKIAGALGKVFGKVPVLGAVLRLVDRITRPLQKAVDVVARAVGRVVRALARGFVDGFTRVFPGIAKTLGEKLQLLPLRIAVAAINVAEKATALARGIGRGILKGAENLGKIIGNVIGRLVKPFAHAGRWLVDEGRDLVSGLLSGIRALFRSVSTTVSRVISRVRSPFTRAGRWLVSAGRNVISGLKNGIVNAIRGIGGWVKSHIVDPVVNAVKHFFGIHSPSTVFAGIGSNLVRGLIKGLAQTNGTAIARKIFGDLPSALGAIVSKGLVAVTSLPGRAMRALGSLGGKILGLLGIGSVPSNVSGNVAIVKRLAAARGWTGAQWVALYKLIQGESGFRNTAQNPTSSAYGMFQFLDSTWRSVGGFKTSNPTLQTIFGLRYIASRYGTPANAYAKWLSRTPHWYGSGVKGAIFNRPTLIGVGERGPERVDVTPLSRGGGDGASAVPLVGTVNINHVPGYSTPQDVVRALRTAELAARFHRRR